MDPVGGVFAGDALARGTGSTFLVREFSSALVPGLVLLAEAGLLAVRLVNGPDAAPLQELGEATTLFTGVAAVLVALILLAFSYIAGYVSRIIAFELLGRWVPAPSEDWHGKHVEEMFGEERVAACLAQHPPLLLAKKKNTANAVVTHDRLGGHARDNNNESHEYAKAWLNRYAPHLSTTTLEYEINVIVASVPLLTLAALLGMSFLGLGWPGLSTLGVASVALVFLLRHYRSLRAEERWQAWRNMFAAFAMAEAGAPQQ